MPFALKGPSGHVGSRGSSFDSGTLFGGCLVHHVGGPQESNGECGRPGRMVEQNRVESSRVGLAVECGGDGRITDRQVWTFEGSGWFDLGSFRFPISFSLPFSISSFTYRLNPES